MTLRPRIQVQEFGAKLRITAAVFGCTSQKALDALFRAADPNTAFDLARSYKWIQGRSVPRESKVYIEWARLLDTTYDADWLASCTLETFAETVGQRHGIAPHDLLAVIGTELVAMASVDVPNHFLCGTYAVYVNAQSPHYAGRLIRGSLTIVPDSGSSQGLVATLVEHFVGLRAAFSGPVLTVPYGLAAHLHSETGTFASAFVGFFHPTPPASLLVGIIASFAAPHPGVQPPYAARLLAVRVPPGAVEMIETSNRYMEFDDDLASDLGALGLPVDAVPELSPRMTAWLAGTDWRWAGSDRLSPSDHIELVSLADRLWLAGALSSADATVPKRAGTAPPA